MNRTPGYNIGKFARTIVLAIVSVLLSLTARAGAVMPSAMRVEIEEADGIGKSSDSVSVKIYYRWDNFDIDTTSFRAHRRREISDTTRGSRKTADWH